MKRNAISNLALKLLREARSNQLNAKCLHCEANVLDALENSANDWAGYGPPTSRIFECPHCEDELEFELKWESVLYWAKPVVKEPS